MNESRSNEDAWKNDALVQVMKIILKEQRRGRLGTIIWRSLLVIGLVVNLSVFMYLQNKTSTSTQDVQHAAVVKVQGPIQSGDYQQASADNIIRSLHKAFDAPNVSGIILDINSPGGSPVQSARVYRELMRLKAMHPDKPVYAVAGDVAASGAYYIAAAADSIYADPTSLVGSIGVIMSSFGFEELIDKVGIERRVYTAGESKSFMDPFTPLDEAAYASINGILEDTHRAFIEDVMATRNGKILISESEAFSGRVWTGNQALEAGMIDGLASPREIATKYLGVTTLRTYSVNSGPLDRILGRITAEVSNQVVQLLSSRMQY